MTRHSGCKNRALEFVVVPYAPIMATTRHQVRFLSGNTFKRTDSVAATVG